MTAGNRGTSLRQDGFVLLRDVLSLEVRTELSATADALRDDPASRSRQVLYTHSAPPEGRPHLDALLDQWLSPHRRSGVQSTRGALEALRPVARELLGEEPVVFQDLILVKRPGQQPFPWHQDYGYWPIDRPEGVVIWAPLSACDPTRGALRVARGSHRLGERPVVDLHVGTPQRKGAELGFDPEAHEVVAPTFNAGDAIAFLPTTFHASPPMTARSTRVAWVSIWLSPRCRWSHAHAPNHPLCRHVPDGEPVQELM